MLSNRKPLHGDNTRLKAVSFIHRLKASLNRHVHYYENHPCSRASGALSGAQIRSLKIGDCCVIDGVFEPVEEADDGLQSARFRAAAGLMQEAVATVTAQVHIRGLRWFARSGLIDHLAAQLASGLAATQAASASLPRRARPQLAPAGGGRRPGA